MKVINVLVILVSSLCMNAAVQAESDLNRIRFGEVGGLNVATSGGIPRSSGLVALAEYLGYFDEAFGPGGPAIEQVFFTGTGPAQNEALAQGDIDFASYGGVPNTIGLANHIPAKIVLTRRNAGSGVYYLGVSKQSDIHTIKDLKGKRITVQKGTNPYRSLLLLLDAHGLSEKDIKLANLQGPEALVAFNTGAVDALLGSDNLLILRDRGVVDLIASTRELDEDSTQSGVLVRNDFARDYPKAVQNVVTALIRAAHWASREENRDALIEFVSARTLNNEKLVAESYQGDLRARFNPVIDDTSVTAYLELANFSLSNRLIRRSVDAADVRAWFAPQYQRRALESLGLIDFWPTRLASDAFQVSR